MIFSVTTPDDDIISLGESDKSLLRRFVSAAHKNVSVIHLTYTTLD